MTAIYDWFGYEMPIKKRYRLIKKAGFDSVMLWWSNGFGRDCFGSDDYRNGPRYAREAGLQIENIHAPFQMPDNLWLNNSDGEALTGFYLQCIADCVELEIPTMVMHLPDDDDYYNALLLDKVNKIAEKAVKHNVNVAFENLRNFKKLEYILSNTDSPSIGFCYDCAHHYRYFPDRDIPAVYGSRLKAIHLHDNIGVDTHRIPFDGTLDWNVIMKKINKTGYEGSVAIEAMNWGYENITAEEFLQKAFASAKRLEELK